MDELRLERALRAGPPFATQYIGRPLSLREEVLMTRTVTTRRTLLLLAVVGLLLAATLAALAIGSLLRPEGTPTLSQGRYSHTAVRLGDGRVLLIGGSRSELVGELVDGVYVYESLASAEVWDPATRLFTPAGSLKKARYGFTATLLADGRVLVVGGGTNPDSPSPPAEFPTAEIWDPASASFSAAGSLADARVEHRAILLADGRVLVVGGRRNDLGNTQGIRSAEIWDPRTESFSAAGQGPASSLALFLSDGKVLAVGTPMSEPFGEGVHLWDPVEGSLSYIGHLEDSHSLGTATLLSDGRVLVVGGHPTGLEAEVFDPATGSPSSAGHLIGEGQNLYGITATLLLDGRVLIVGGGAESGGALAAQVWDPATSSFNLTGQHAEVRSYHSATLLADGRVLIVGGVTLDGSLATAEIWDPATGAFSPAGSTEPSAAP
jgi:hypothetical protein